MTHLNKISLPGQYTLTAARVESNVPLAYRLVRRGDGNRNMLPVLQGMFTWRQGEEFGREWRDLETQDEPYVEDHIPFGSLFPA